MFALLRVRIRLPSQIAGRSHTSPAGSRRVKKGDSPSAQLAGHNQADEPLNSSCQLLSVLLKVSSTTHRVDIEGKRWIGDEVLGRL